MPIYDFEHNETGKRWTDVVTYDDKPAYCIEHNCKYIILSVPPCISQRRDNWSQTDDGCKERMKGIKATGGQQTTLE